MSNVINFAPDGDTILVVRSSDKQLKYRVSSAMLAAASPIFKDMFAKDRFAEDADFTSVAPREFLLPNDDLTVMNMYIKLCHHKQDFFTRLSIVALRDLAVLISKYQSQGSFQALINLMMTKKINEGVIATEFGILMDAAYLMDDAEMFRKLSSKYMQSVTCKLDAPEKWRACPREVQYFLANQASEAKLKLLHIVNQGVKNILLEPHRHSPDCHRLKAVRAAYLEHLIALPWGPFNNLDVNERTLTSIIAAIRALPTSFTCVVDRSLFCKKLGCQNITDVISSPVGQLTVAPSVMLLCRTLCLRCLRSDGVVASAECVSQHDAATL